jgi:hypothetical protein
MRPAVKPHDGMKQLHWILLRLRLYQTLSPTKKRLAQKYLSGNGIESGALHLPLIIPEGATIRYFDHSPMARLRERYPELSIFHLILRRS